MIKQIWFIRNERKLINGLCLTIGILILLYAVLSVWALADAEYSDMLKNAVAQPQSYLYRLMFERIQLILLPLGSLLISILLCWQSNQVKSEKNVAITNQMRRDLLIGTNLIVVLILSFIEINILSNAKSIASFGLIPVYLIAIGGAFFYYKMFKKILIKKRELK